VTVVRGSSQHSDSFDEIVRIHQAAVLAYASSMLRDKSLVDDAVQETFLRVWRYLPSYRGDGSFEGWVIRICRNVCVSLGKKSGSISHLQPSGQGESDPYEEVNLMSLLDALSHDHREVALLCLVFGYPYEEAASVMGVPIGTVRSRLARARAELRVMTTCDDNFKSRFRA